MSQDKERDAFERRMLDFGWRNFTGDVQGEPPCWYYANADLNARWIGWREARAALATQPPAVQGEPIAWALMTNGKPNAPRGRTLSWEPPCNESLQIAAIEGETWMPLCVCTPSREVEPLTDEQIRGMCKHGWVFETVKQWVRIVEACHGIHSRGEGEKA